MRAAEQADDPIRLAGARGNLAQVLLADRQAQVAEAVAMQALEDLRALTTSGDPNAAALSGSLLLVAAIAAVRTGNAGTGRDRLNQAAPLASHVGERNTCWTAFGPTNVAMFAVSIEVESGEAVEGLRLARKINHGFSPSIERRVAFLLDQAKGHCQRRNFAAAMALLSTAERDAPEDIRFRPTAHVLLRKIVERAQRPVALQAARLVGRVGFPH
jgi:hypothetical protein